VFNLLILINAVLARQESTFDLSNASGPKIEDTDNSKGNAMLSHDPTGLMPAESRLAWTG
jgi:hypothetical protein